MESTWTRNCPICNKVVSHKTKASRDVSLKADKKCRSCTATEINLRPGMRDHFVGMFATNGCNTGSNNAFFGQKHSAKTIESLKFADKSYTKNKEFSDRVVEGMVGKTIPHPSNYSVWVNKFGKAEADVLQSARSKKLSISMQGCSNPMYGKPAPQGSGNGWSGWYDGWYFRSLKELSYAHIHLRDKKWMSAEKAGIKITYIDWKGSNRTYVPDFLVEGTILVEIKPKRLHKTPAVQSKAVAARSFCEKVGFTYELIDFELLPTSDIIGLHDSGRLKFLDRYESKYKEYLEAFNHGNHN
jgi:hypothetical protein